MRQIGIRLLDNLGSASQLIDLAIRAEELNFDSVWFPHDAYRLNSWTMLSAVAARTNRISLGSRQNVYTTHPSEIATYISTLDQLAPGRTIVAPGLHNTDTLDWSGIAHENYLRRTREAVDIIRGLLRGERVAYEGCEFRTSDRAFMRVPPTGEHIPVYVAPFGEDFMELSGEIGDGSVPMITPPASAPLVVDAVARGAKRAGRDASAVPITGFVWLCVSEDGQLARDMVADVISLFGAYLDKGSLATLGLQPSDFAVMHDRRSRGDTEGARQLVTPTMLELAVHGTPSDCIEQMEQIFDSGVSSVVVGGPLGPVPHEAIELVGSSIIPYFRQQ